jgi:prepilin-type N-terminal cleavage/methylation domain-containing protein
MAGHAVAVAAAGPRPPARRSPLASRPGPRRAEGGFTLVEILVVLAIIAILIGLAATTIPMAQRARRNTQASTLLTGIKAELAGLQMDREAFGRFPPTRCQDLRIGRKQVGKDLGTPANDLNVGIETVWFVLNCPDIPARQITTDATLIGNTDADNFRAALSSGGDSGAREYLDPWGNPLVYFHCNDYKEPKGCARIKTGTGETLEVRPKRMPKAAGGAYLGPNSYQLFSLGPNGVQDDDEAEDGDDVVVTGE